MTSPQGETYLEFVKDLLNKEYEQRKMIEGRAAVIVTSSASLLTIIVGISVLVTGKEFRFASNFAVVLVIGSLVLFVAAALLAIWIQVYHYTGGITEKSLLNLVNASWADSEVHARQTCARIAIVEIGTLRQEISWKSRLVAICLLAQVGAIVLLTAAIAIEIAAR